MGTPADVASTRRPAARQQCPLSPGLSPTAVLHFPPPQETAMPAVRGQGQWALGYREPLNPAEQVKKDDSALNVKQRVLDIYSKQGFDSIDAADLRTRLRAYGLYTQRADGIPGGRTAVLEPHELEAPFFMLRIRIDGGQLSSTQLAVIGEIATRVRPRRRRHHRPAERAAALDPDRGRPDDLGAPGGRRPGHHRGLRRRAARHHRLPPGGRAGRRGDRRRTGGPGARRPLRRRPGVREPAAQVQDVGLRVLGALHQPRDQRRRLRGGRPRRARRGLRPVGRRRPVDQPQARRAPGRVRRAVPGRGGLGRRSARSSATTATAAPATTPA